jgi:hypothetical protein
VKFNPKKTESLIISRKPNTPNHPRVFMNNVEFQEVSSHKHLGLIFANNLKWNTHIDYVLGKA